MSYSSFITYLVFSFASPNTESVLNKLEFSQEGTVSYYHGRFHGKKTSSGEKYDKTGYTAAHKTLPYNTLIELQNPRNGKVVTVRINDRGPYGKTSRILDISQAAAKELDIIKSGIAKLSFKVVGSNGVRWADVAVSK
jgi:rare lipoprotein A